MNRALTHEEAETAILSRMAASRMALLETNSTPPINPAAKGQPRLAAASFLSALADAPRVTLVLALCVSAIVLGPARTVGIAGRSGTTALLGGSVRKLVHTALSASRN
ncbi:MAG: hypothetical protein WCA85_11700 [Paraburkholderia sp.]|uniref:hypothetical protein n=1 Tax=Paraburkholderia sp. TaxID=1926495 RepID=UPI003C4EA5D1